MPLSGQLAIRFAREEDIPLLLTFIRELADYERMLDQVVATEDSLRVWMFEKRTVEALLAELDGEAVGFALFFHNFSTFLGRGGIYLEDLYVRPQARGLGLGKALLRRLAALALERGCGRLEWWCLDWNTPSMDFYLAMGAEPMSDWTVYRVTGRKLEQLASGRVSATPSD